MAGLRRCLDREWAAVSGSRSSHHRLAVWLHELGEDPAAGWEPFLSAHGPELDRVLGVLARRADRDDLAARALLQAVMPGLEALARRLARRCGRDGEDVFAEVLSLAWLRIRRFPYQPCPRAIPVRILLDVKKQFWALVNEGDSPVDDVVMTACQTRRSSAEQEQGAVDDGGETTVRSLTTRLALRHAVDSGAVDRTAAGVVWRTRVLDEPVVEVAAELGRPVDAVYQWRSWHERRLRDVFCEWGLAS